MLYIKKFGREKDVAYSLADKNSWSFFTESKLINKPARQKEVADMLNMVSYAEENGKKEGRKEGRKEGKKEGENRLGSLMKVLLKNKRYSDAEKASEDETYREELYKEYKL